MNFSAHAHGECVGRGATNVIATPDNEFCISRWIQVNVRAHEVATIPIGLEAWIMELISEPQSQLFMQIERGFHVEHTFIFSEYLLVNRSIIVSKKVCTPVPL